MNKINLLARNVIKKRLKHKCFFVKFEKFLKTSFLKNICKWLLLCFDLRLTSRRPEVFLGKGVLKYAANLQEKKHPCRSAISIKLLCNFIEISAEHRRSPVNLLQIFRTLFPGTSVRGCF